MLLTAAEYSSIRAALDVGLDDEALPDSIIELPIYSGAAELEILRRIPDLYTRNGIERRKCVNAMILLTAAYLAPAVPQITSETLGDVSRNYQAIDWLKFAAELRGRADSMMVELTIGKSTAIPSLFSLASGRRGS